MKIPLITDVNVKGKKVLVRAPFDVPLKNGKITDISRIKSALPTIEYLLKNGAGVVLVSKLGRPEGKKVRKLSLSGVAKELSKLLGKKVNFVGEAVGKKAQKAKDSLNGGEIVLLENLRFYKGEEENNPAFAKSLADGMDIFVMEDFPNAKNAHAGTVGVAGILPAYAGINFEAEIRNLSALFENPPKPLVAVIGGAKISTKVDVLRTLLSKVDVLILGGGMANTIFVAEGYDIGRSLYEEGALDVAEDISRSAFDEGVEVILPDDVLVAKKPGAKTKPKDIDEVGKSEMIVDVGPKSIAKFSEPLKFAGTIFWNGPMGISEFENSRKGTEAVAKIISASKAKSIIGGGDTLASVAGEKLDFDFVSTGGGATLEFIAGKDLPALTVLLKKK